MDPVIQWKHNGEHIIELGSRTVFFLILDKAERLIKEKTDAVSIYIRMRYTCPILYTF